MARNLKIHTFISDQYLGKLMEYTKDKFEYYARRNESRNEANKANEASEASEASETNTIPTWYLVGQMITHVLGRINVSKSLTT